MSGKGKLTFTQLFKVPVLLSSFGGLYVPGAHKLLPMSYVFDKLFKILSFLAHFFILITLFEVPIAVIQKYPKKLRYFLLAGSSMVLCGFLKLFYMVIRRNEWSNLIHQWDISFQQPLFTDQRMSEMDKEKKFVERIVKWQYAIMVIPVIFWAILPPLVAGKQSVESVLPWDHTKSPTFEITATYHFLYGVFLTATWSANDSWMMIYMSLVTAELRHLRFSLTTIFSRLRATTAGTIIVDNTEITDFEEEKIKIGSYYKETNNVRKRLNLWIDHHSELISFSFRLRNFYAPLLLLHYLFFVWFNCMMLFYVASGLLPPVYIMVAMGLTSAHGSALLLMSWFGDRIITQNTLLSQELFHQDWFLYSKDIGKSLKFIMIQSRRPLELSAFSLMPLNIKTFEQILKTCYSFFMFIKDSSRKTFDKET